jgi:hypothetical protein
MLSQKVKLSTRVERRKELADFVPSWPRRQTFAAMAAPNFCRCGRAAKLLPLWPRRHGVMQLRSKKRAASAKLF